MKPFAPDHTHHQRDYPQKLLMKPLAVINNAQGAMTDSPARLVGRKSPSYPQRRTGHTQKNHIYRDLSSAESQKRILPCGIPFYPYPV
ncbi:hypothetical protein NPIL_208341 [Nephila pilipes]|uniref:Uncharacterized protein n=1 Tax=Nephila pilipes TaxID=299642 RepID=A0A8X6TKZ4_NEPPI|nr:hypothetical protein NPIL_208341 [Nephila pilipes]